MWHFTNVWDYIISTTISQRGKRDIADSKFFFYNTRVKKYIVFFLLSIVSFIYIYPQTRLEASKRIHSLWYFSPCDTPLTYTVDVIDNRFGISKEDFVKDLAEAETIWEQVDGKNLFSYDPKGVLSISMIYDQRQYLNSQISQLEGSLDTSKGSIQKRVQEYEERVNAFKQKLVNLNAEISDWNKKGGAPKDVYDRLIQDQENLKQEAEALNALAKTVNRSADSYNAQVGDLNQTIQTFNNELNLKPEEGLYIGRDKRIEIYFNNNHDELVHTLAHELGHALDMNHNENRLSIMYPYTTQKIAASSDDRAALAEVCRERPITEKLALQMALLLAHIQKRQF